MMGFKDLKSDFEKEVGELSGPTDEKHYRYWMLRLLFEIAGNLDSLVVSNRNAEKHIERMSTAYVRLVTLQEMKMDPPKWNKDGSLKNPK